MSDPFFCIKRKGILKESLKGNQSGTFQICSAFMLDISLLAEAHHFYLPYDEQEKETKNQENSDKDSEESQTRVSGFKNLQSLAKQVKHYVVLHPTDSIRNGDTSREEGQNAIFRRKRNVITVIDDFLPFELVSNGRKFK